MDAVTGLRVLHEEGEARSLHAVQDHGLQPRNLQREQEVHPALQPASARMVRRENQVNQPYFIEFPSLLMPVMLG